MNRVSGISPGIAQFEEKLKGWIQKGGRQKERRGWYSGSETQDKDLKISDSTIQDLININLRFQIAA